VDIPLGTLRALLMKQIEADKKEDKDDSDSEDEENMKGDSDSDNDEDADDEKGFKAKGKMPKESKTMPVVQLESQLELDLSKLSYE